MTEAGVRLERRGGIALVTLDRPERMNALSTALVARFGELGRELPGVPQIDVQQTAFSVDAVGRYTCSTWHEATLLGGPPPTAVVVGAGMCGA